MKAKAVQVNVEVLVQTINEAGQVERNDLVKDSFVEAVLKEHGLDQLAQEAERRVIAGDGGGP